MHTHQLILCLLVLILIATFGCGDSARSELEYPSDGQEVGLPLLIGTANCIETPAPPPLCDWVTGLDAIVWAEVRGIALIDDPVAVNGNLIAQCSGPMNRGMTLDVMVKSTLWGDTPAQLTVAFGTGQLDHWEPRPARDLDGREYWPDTGPRLAVGQHLALPLVHDPSADRWMVIHEPIAHEVDDARGQRIVQFQDTAHDDCRQQPPAALHGKTRASLAASFQDCAPTPASQARRAYYEQVYTMHPEAAYASVCIQGFPQGPPPECSVNADCAADALCVQARCVVQ